jgi:nucleotide-binding universal stress UspA family protein
MPGDVCFGPAGGPRVQPRRALSFQQGANRRAECSMGVMVATDGSRQSLEALPHAARLAAAIGEPLTLVRVLDPRADAASEVATSLEAAVEHVAERWQHELRGFLGTLGVKGDACVVAKRRAEPIEETLLRAARELGAGIVALESGRIGGLRQAILGSMAMGLVGRSSLPVMVTSKPAPPATDDNVYRLLATNDGSPAARDVLVALGPLLSHKPIDLSMLRVIEHRAGDFDEAGEIAAARLELEHVAGMLPVAGAVEVLVKPATPGRPVQNEILRVASDIRADAIAMSTHGHSALRNLLMGSVALGVLKDSPVPVILARGES